MTEKLRTKQVAAGSDPIGSIFLPNEQDFERRVLALTLGRQPYAAVSSVAEQMTIYDRLCADRARFLGADAVELSGSTTV